VDESVITKKKELIQLYIECLACCQGIARVNDKLIGGHYELDFV
jgi:hypothetical protein